MGWLRVGAVVVIVHGVCPPDEEGGNGEGKGGEGEEE